MPGKKAPIAAIGAPSGAAQGAVGSATRPRVRMAPVAQAWGLPEVIVDVNTHHHLSHANSFAQTRCA